MKKINARGGMLSIPDSPNHKYYETPGVAEAHGVYTSLMKAAETILSPLREELKDKPILDIGVGPGRTTPHLKAISNDYIGTDYSEKMIELAKKRVADATLLVCDARDMSVFDDEQFAAVFFWGGGMDDVNSSDRILILKEINRVLKKNGVFSVSSHNLSYKQDDYFYSKTTFWANPKGLIKNYFMCFIAIMANLFARIRNKINGKGWAIILEYDEVKDFILPTYYISKEAQIRQLLDAGFTQVEVVGMDGFPVDDNRKIRDLFLYYAARKR